MLLTCLEIVAIHGSMVQLYLDNEGVELYRILEMESKYGNIVGRCIRLRQDEIEYLKLQREKAQASRNLDDIEEFSQPAVLPAYEPQDDDQEVSILFSFRFSQMSKAAKDRFLRESLVAVFDKGHQDANIITTKFMAESLHWSILIAKWHETDLLLMQGPREYSKLSQGERLSRSSFVVATKVA